MRVDFHDLTQIKTIFQVQKNSSNPRLQTAIRNVLSELVPEKIATLISNDEMMVEEKASCEDEKSKKVCQKLKEKNDGKGCKKKSTKKKCKKTCGFCKGNFLLTVHHL